MRPNYAFKPTAEQALRSSQLAARRRLNAALGFNGGGGACSQRPHEEDGLLIDISIGGLRLGGSSLRGNNSLFLLKPALVFMALGLCGIGFGIAVMLAKALGWEKLANFLIVICIALCALMSIVWLYAIGMKVLAWVGIVDDERES